MSWRNRFQPKLPGVKYAADHANLGGEFERLLEASHSEYKLKGLAIIEKNPVEWLYCGKSDYEFLAAIPNADLTAKTPRGNYLKKAKSDVDYSGVLKGGRAIYFDAKQTGEKSFPFANLEKHQVENIAGKERLGAIAGLMIYFTRIEQVYYVPASTVERLFFAQIAGGRKSISLEACKAEGREIPKKGNRVDWYQILSK